MTLDGFAALLEKAKRKPSKEYPMYEACCPAHEDKTPSFAVWEKDGWLHVKCQAGCSEDAVLGAMGLSQEDRRVNAYGPTLAQLKPKEIIHPYRRLDGSYVFEKVRFGKDHAPPFQLRIRNPDGSYQYSLKGLNGETKLPYGLPELFAATQARKIVIIGEGEKAVDRLAKAGIVATCQAFGATKDKPESKWLPEHTKWFDNADVIVLADRDEVGETYSRYVAREVSGIANRVRVAQSRTEGEHDDGYDHWQAGFGIDDLVWRPDLAPKRGFSVRVNPIAMEPVNPAFLVEPYLPEGKCVLLDADGGTGKSSMAAAWGAALSRGQHPLTFEKLHTPVKTLYLHKGEDQDEEIETIYRANGGVPGMMRFAGSPVDGDGDDIYFDAPGLRALKEVIQDGGYQLVVVDALFYFIEGVCKDAYVALDVLSIMRKLNAIANETRATFLNIRHTSKGIVGKAASELGMGSVQFRNSHRGQMVARWSTKQKGVVIVTDEKGSLLVPRGDAFAYRRVDCEIQYLNSFINPFDGDSEVSHPGTKLEAAKQLLRDLLGGGHMVAANEVLRHASAIGISAGTIKNARKAMDVKWQKQTGVTDGEVLLYILQEEPEDPFAED